MRYVRYTELGDEPNVIVDGSGTPSTVLTLSHWPGSTVPDSLQADLSAEIVVRYLEQPEHHVDVDAVSNNHLDQDGLIGVWALVEPEQALERRDLVIDVARAGDFTWSHTRNAARIAFTIGALVDVRTSTIDPHEEFLPLVPQLLDDIASFRDLWAEEDAFLDATNAAVDGGDITIEEHSSIDLAVVTIPPRPMRPYHRFTQHRNAPLHPMAVFNRTEMTRIAYLCDRSYAVELRYESVVQFVSHPILQRPDLTPLADRMNELESSGGRWRCESIGSLTPQLRLDDAEASSLAPDAFLDELLAFLPDARAAWDPWTETGFR